MKNVLFVCTGNTCRSPMAEALFNHHTKDIQSLSSSSCGIFADGVSPMSNNALRVLKEADIEFTHISTPITEDLIRSADYVIGMTANHAKNIISMFPEFSAKVYTMPKDISDPYGGDIGIYRQCRNEIEKCVKILINTLLGEKND